MIIAAIIVFFSVVFFLITRKIIKAIFLASSTLFVIILILSFFIFADVMNLKENLESEPKIFLLEDDSKILTGMVFSDMSDFNSMNFLPEDDLKNLGSSYMKHDYESMLDEKFLMFIFSMEAFENSDSTIIEVEDQTFEKELIFQMLRSDDPIQIFIEDQGYDNIPEGISPEQRADIIARRREQMGSSSDFKGNLFGMLVGTEMMDRGPIFIFSEYKKDNILIYPETAVFKFIDMVPRSLIDKVFNFVNERLGAEQ